MPSPFPGMNPYLEQNDAWANFHHLFIAQTQKVLNPQVGDHYFVKIDERVYIRELPEEERRFLGRGDGVVTQAPDRGTGGSGGTCLAVAPVKLSLPAVDIQRESFLEIRDRRDRRVVTVIELLSPSNKAPGEDHNAYLAKRNALLRSMAHFVEIDLRRGGQRPQPPVVPACDYYALVSRYRDRPQLGFWPIRLRERLPSIPIPLADPDPDVHLDLQPILHQVYDDAGFGKYIYTEAPQPPLLPDDAAWAQQFVPKPPG